MKEIVPPPLSLALCFLRMARGWSQARLASAAGISGPALCEFERRALSRDMFDRLASLMGFESDAIDLSLLYVAGLHPSSAQVAVTPVDLSGAEDLHTRRIAAYGGLIEAGRLRARLQAELRRERAATARREAKDLWDSLRLVAPERQAQWVADHPGTAQWALAERLCEQSTIAAENDPKRRLHLARLALQVAESVPGDVRWRSCLRGYCHAFVANALRVGGDLAGAEAEISTAWGLWRSGGSAGQGPLAEWRILDLELSLRRALRQFEEAQILFQRALAITPIERRGHLLLKQSMTLEYSGRLEEALAVLNEASVLADSNSDAREQFIVRFNRLALFCQLGRFELAKEDLPEVRRRASVVGNKEDGRRLKWLAARVAAGLGDESQARRDFAAVQREFAKDRNAYGCALVSLDLAILYLERGQPAKVARIAEEIMWVFASHRIQREALAALRLFVDAAQSGIATAEEVARIFRLLERARLDRRLLVEDSSMV